VLPPGWRALDAAGVAIPGAKLKFYNAGTLTPKTVYSDEGLSTSLGTVVTCDSGGYPTSDGNTQTLVYTGTALYKLVITTSADVVVSSHDSIKGAVAVPVSDDIALPETPVITRTASYNVLTADQGSLINADPTSASFPVTLPSSLTAGDGFRIGVRHASNSTNTVTVRTTGNETIGLPGQTAATAVSLTGLGHTMWFVCDGAGWTVDTIVPAKLTSNASYISVADRLTATSTSPTGGTRYIINGSPTGTWATLGFAANDIVEADGNGGWHKFTPTAGVFAYVVAAGLFTRFDGAAWADQTGMSTPSTSTLKRMVVQNIQSTGADGGSVSSGVITTATLNALVTNAINGASLAANLITLPAGTYDIQAWKSFSGGNASQANTGKIRLYNVTAGAAISNAIGTPATAGSNGSGVPTAGATSTLRTVQTFAVTTVLRLDIIATSSDGTAIGLGEPAGQVSEVYAQVDILDLSSLQGPIGATGPTGADGLDAAIPLQWSTSTSGDPGAGKIALNNATFLSATQLAVSETNSAGASIAATIATWDDSTSAVRARVKIGKEGNPGVYKYVSITGASTDQGTYRTFPITPIEAVGTISDTNDCAVLVVEKGDKGDTGERGEKGLDGAGIKAVLVDADGQLVVTLSDGTVERAGRVAGRDGRDVSDDLIASQIRSAVQESVDAAVEAAVAKALREAPPPKDGASIIAARLSADGELMLSRSDGKPLAAGSLKSLIDAAVAGLREELRREILEEIESSAPAAIELDRD